jgi:hypothetical protein
LQPMQIIMAMKITNAMESWIWEVWQTQKSLLKKLTTRFHNKSKPCRRRKEKGNNNWSNWSLSFPSQKEMFTIFISYFVWSLSSKHTQKQTINYIV